MPGIALSSATKGRLRPSFFFCLQMLLGAALLPVLAQQPVYRCGSEYTNAPQEANRCERLAPQSVTVIPGTRVQGATAPAAVGALPTSHGSPSGAVPGQSAPQRSRDEMARTIVGAELDKARERLGQLQDEQRQSRSASPGDDPQQQQRLARLQAEIERTVRDIESLQRELARRPQTTP
jgi:hypothetical protein